MSDMTAAEFAAHRRLTGLTYDELSDELGVHQRTVRSWESGRHPVPERVGDEMRDLVDKNARLGRQLAEAGLGRLRGELEHLLDVAVIPRDGWHIQAAARAVIIEPDVMIEWADR